MLTAYPCADKHNDVTTISSNSQAHSQHNHSHDEETDLCSPFCVCNCCGMTLSVSQINTLLPEHHKVVIKDILPDGKYDHKTLHPAGIWQPPKIG